MVYVHFNKCMCAFSLISKCFNVWSVYSGFICLTFFCQWIIHTQWYHYALLFIISLFNFFKWDLFLSTIKYTSKNPNGISIYENLIWDAGIKLVLKIYNYTFSKDFINRFTLIFFSNFLPFFLKEQISLFERLAILWNYLQ